MGIMEKIFVHFTARAQQGAQLSDQPLRGR
jgi:hypothetical protein